MNESSRRIPRALSLPVIFSTSVIPAALIMLTALLGGTESRREISLHIVESPDELLVLGSGQANTPEEEAILRQTRDALGRPGLNAPVRITETVKRRGLGLPPQRGESLLLFETSRTHEISILILARMGGSQMYYRTGSGIDERDMSSRLENLPPEVARRMGWAPIENLDAQREIDRVLQALAEFARTNASLNLIDTADLIADGGGQKTIENLLSTVVLFSIAGALTLLFMIPLLMLRVSVISMSRRIEAEHSGRNLSGPE